MKKMRKFSQSEGRRDNRGDDRGSGRSYGNRSRDRPSYGDRRERPSYGGRSNDRPRRDSRDTEMHRVICSACGVECEVPFKPTSSKPVYCNDCFKKDGNNSKGSSGADYSKDLERINQKLDMILDKLNMQ